MLKERKNNMRVRQDYIKATSTELSEGRAKEDKVPKT